MELVAPLLHQILQLSTGEKVKHILLGAVRTIDQDSSRGQMARAAPFFICAHKYKDYRCNTDSLQRIFSQQLRQDQLP